MGMMMMLFAAMLVPLAALPAIADTEYSHLDSDVVLEKTTLALSIPADNKMPWAFIEGKIANPAADHPVIIQIYDADDLRVSGNEVGAVRFAQVPVNQDGTYEYKLRIADASSGQLENVLEGDYIIKIFKVVRADLAGF